MSKEWGILYHIGGRLRKDKGWSETESDNPPDKFWEGDIENKLPNGFGTYTHTNGTTYVGQYKDGLREGQGVLLQMELEKSISRVSHFLIVQLRCNFNFT